MNASFLNQSTKSRNGYGGIPYAAHNVRPGTQQANSRQQQRGVPQNGRSQSKENHLPNQ